MRRADQQRARREAREFVPARHGRPEAAEAVSAAEQIQRDTKAALKERDRIRVGALRMIGAALKNGEIEAGRALEEHEEQTILLRPVQQREETGATGMGDMGAVMGRAMDLSGGRAEGRELSALARNRLQ